jgi:hypothetical protein
VSPANPRHKFPLHSAQTVAFYRKATVRSWLTYKRPRSVRTFAVVGFALALWLAIVALAASPQLHHWLHKDSQDPHHYCLFTQLNQHLLLAAFAPTVAAEPPQLAARAPFIFASASIPSFDYAVSHGRAPPSLSSSRAVVG